MKKLIIQLVKFGIVGVIATLVDFGVLLFLREIMHVDVMISTAAGFCVSVIANYVLSMLFVFKGSEDGKMKEFVLFVVLSVGGLIINELIMWLGTDVLVVYYLYPKIVSCVFVPVYNFVTRKIFLEKKAP